MIDFAKTDYGQEEIEAVNRVLKSNFLASGQENEAFEKEFSSYIGTRYAVAVNSGSSANLLALASLGLKPKDKVLTSACGFPATLSPILHLGLTPIFVDYNLETHNIDIQQAKRTIPFVKAFIFAHTLGNPVEIDEIRKEADRFGVKIIEDCCEAVGSKINGKYVGGIGDLGTFSFYPAHQITALGGGGMVVTNDTKIYKKLKSMRDWGKMYDWDSDKGGNLTDYKSPIGYHRGYTYTNVGWNFKLPEANCAFGREQLKKLEGFKKTRMENWNYLYDSLKELNQLYIPPISQDSNPFGFCMHLKEGNRNGFGLYLESKGIRHRPFFAGNILRQPAFKRYIAKNFKIADILMENGLFVGCHTKLTKDNMNYMIELIRYYVDSSSIKLQRE